MWILRAQHTLAEFVNSGTALFCFRIASISPRPAPNLFSHTWASSSNPIAVPETRTGNSIPRYWFLRWGPALSCDAAWVALNLMWPSDADCKRTDTSGEIAVLALEKVWCCLLGHGLEWYPHAQQFLVWFGEASLRVQWSFEYWNMKWTVKWGQDQHHLNCYMMCLILLVHFSKICFCVSDIMG